MYLAIEANGELLIGPLRSSLTLGAAGRVTNDEEEAEAVVTAGEAYGDEDEGSAFILTDRSGVSVKFMACVAFVPTLIRFNVSLVWICSLGPPAAFLGLALM